MCRICYSISMSGCPHYQYEWLSLNISLSHHSISDYTLGLRYVEYVLCDTARCDCICSVILWDVIVYSVILRDVIVYSVILWDVIVYSVILWDVIVYSVILRDVIVYSVILRDVIVYVV